MLFRSILSDRKDKVPLVTVTLGKGYYQTLGVGQKTNRGDRFTVCLNVLVLYFPSIHLLPMVLIILMSSEPKRAYQKFSTANPSINEAANKNSPALITSVKSPRVRIVIGRVSTTRIGFTTALRSPRITAAITAVKKLSTLIPGK